MSNTWATTTELPVFDSTTWHRYAGLTVAVRAGRLLAYGSSVADVWAALRETPWPDPEAADYVIWVPTQAASYASRFAEWEEKARDIHREFKRRLRG